MAKSRTGQALLLPNGLRLIRVFPEWVSGWPLWESFTDEYRLDNGSLPITPELGRDLFDWNEEWLDRAEDQPLPNPDGWRARGFKPLQLLQKELEGIAESDPSS